MSHRRLGEPSPFIGPQRLWDALDASIGHRRPPGNPDPPEPAAETAAGGLAAAPASAFPRLDECTLDAHQRHSPGWTLKKTEGCGFVSVVLVEDLEHDMRPGGGKPGSGLAIHPGDPLWATLTDEERDTQLAVLRRKAIAAARRARGNMSWKLRMLRADRLWTLTKRGRIETRDDAWALWGEFERVMSRRYPWFKCVVVIEAHKLDGFHIHFAGNRYMHVDCVRLIWHRVLTCQRLRSPLRGVDAPGNVDVEYRPTSVRRLCNYMGKYLGKGFDAPEELGRRFKRYAA